MYLNVRRPPLRSKISLNPFTLRFPRAEPSHESASRSLTRSSPTDRGTSVPIPPIPPTANPRGELIFSSRVDRSFRESYERYRAAFERKRQERERSDAMQTWLGWLCFQMPWNKPPVVHLLAVPQVRTATSSTRGRGVGSVFPTPSPSRRSSPMTRASRRGTPAVCSSQLLPPQMNEKASLTVTVEQLSWTSHTRRSVDGAGGGDEVVVLYEILRLESGIGKRSVNTQGEKQGIRFLIFKGCKIRHQSPGLEETSERERCRDQRASST